MPFAASATSSGSTALAVILSALLIIALVAAYWVPSIVARVRRVPNLGQVVVVNFLLGWSVIGWIVALVMALKPVPPYTPPPYRPWYWPGR